MTLIRIGALAGLAAAVLAVVALVGFVVVVGAAPLADVAGSGPFIIPAAAALGSVTLLGVALVGLHARQSDRSGALGTAGFVVALLGTMLTAGAQWTYVFVVPHIAGAVPDLVNEGTGVLLAGFVISYAALSVGWVLFGIATLRAAVFPRWMAFLLIAGAVIAFLPLPSRTLVLAIAAALLGSRLLSEPEAARADPTGRPVPG